MGAAMTSECRDCRNGVCEIHGPAPSLDTLDLGWLVIIRNAMSAQCHGVRFALHIGSTVYGLGRKKNGSGPRLELCTPLRWFRLSRGYSLPPAPAEKSPQPPSLP